jgi:hypothetical protein
VDTKTPLRERPGMDDMKIGPAGQTFGQLKQAVLDARAAFQAELMKGEADDTLMASYGAAVDLLRAAYTRVGLPYTAP